MLNKCSDCISGIKICKEQYRCSLNIKETGNRCSSYEKGTYMGKGSDFRVVFGCSVDEVIDKYSFKF